MFQGPVVQKARVLAHEGEGEQAQGCYYSAGSPRPQVPLSQSRSSPLLTSSSITQKSTTPVAAKTAATLSREMPSNPETSLNKQGGRAAKGRAPGRVRPQIKRKCLQGLFTKNSTDDTAVSPKIIRYVSAAPTSKTRIGRPADQRFSHVTSQSFL